MITYPSQGEEGGLGGVTVEQVRPPSALALAMRNPLEWIRATQNSYERSMVASNRDRR